MSEAGGPGRCRTPAGTGEGVRWLLSGLALALFGVIVAATRGVTMADEGWFLQVVRRVAGGETLYRDVFFGATPLSVHLVSGLTAVFGIEALVLRGAMALIYASTVLVSWRIARSFGAGREPSLLLGAALTVFGAPEANSPYAALANLLFLACFGAALAWRRRLRADGGASGASGFLAAAGVAAGLSFSAKQNVGLCALAALLVLAAIVPGRGPGEAPGRLRRVALVLAAFSLSALLVLLPVLLGGGGGKFLEYGFLNKGTYLRLGGISYFDGVPSPGDILSSARSVRRFGDLYASALFLLPFATFGALGAAWLRSDREGRGETAAVVLFAAGALAGVFPRADIHHLYHAVPELLLGLAYAWPRIRPGAPGRWDVAARRAVTAWLIAGVVLLAREPLKIGSSRWRFSSIPHYRGVLMNAELHEKAKTTAGAIAAFSASGDRPFLLSPDAGFHYVVSGSRNPTAFDYPYATAMGRNGETEVIDAIAAGRIRTVFLDTRSLPPRLVPARLVNFVSETMDRTGEAGFFAVYRGREARGTESAREGVASPLTPH